MVDSERYLSVAIPKVMSKTIEEISTMDSLLNTNTRVVQEGIKLLHSKLNTAKTEVVAASKESKDVEQTITNILNHRFAPKIKDMTDEQLKEIIRSTMDEYAGNEIKSHNQFIQKDLLSCYAIEAL